VAAHTILRDRAPLQIKEAGEIQFAKKLFGFWGTDIEEFRRRVTFNLVDASGQKEIAGVIDPLVGLRKGSREVSRLLRLPEDAPANSDRLSALDLWTRNWERGPTSELQPAKDRRINGRNSVPYHFLTLIVDHE
jgi:hypothetical protein